MIAAMIISTDQKVMYSIACKNTTPFVKIEEKLYETYPEYKETENYSFLVGVKLKDLKQLEKIKLKTEYQLCFILKINQFN